MVELERRAGLLDDAALQHHDLVGERHRLDLVVGHVDHGGGEFVVQPCELDAHLDPERRVEVGERLVEQEHLGRPHDRAADRDPLTLAAGKGARLAVEELLELQDACRLEHLGVALGLGHARKPKREAHVVAHGHVRIERIGLEHHREPALGRRHVVDPLAVDHQVARGDLLEPRDHAQQGRLAAA